MTSLQYFIQKLYHRCVLFSIFLQKKAIHLPLVEVGDFLLFFCLNYFLRPIIFFKVFKFKKIIKLVNYTLIYYYYPNLHLYYDVYVPFYFHFIFFHFHFALRFLSIFLNLFLIKSNITTLLLYYTFFFFMLLMETCSHFYLIFFTILPIFSLTIKNFEKHFLFIINICRHNSK